MKIMLGLVITILFVFTVTLFWPGTSSNHVESMKAGNRYKQNSYKVSSELTVIDASTQVSKEKQQAMLMKAEYEKLKQARTELKRLLARIKNEIWGLKFSSEQAREINYAMLNAYKFEKTPRMLGAFLDVEEIQAEIEKVKFASKELQDVEAQIAIAKKPTT